MDPALRGLIERCRGRFAEHAGRDAEVVTCAPGRVNLIGEHTDYNDGFVLPMAIDRWCVAVGARGKAARGRIWALDLGEWCEYDPSGRDGAALPRWARYVAGMVWLVRDAASRTGHGDVGALDIALASTVPMGAGLSSSAAVELATGALVNEAFGLGLRPRELAELGQSTEHRHAGVPCGIMDQMASACGVDGGALLIDCRSMATRPVRLPEGVAIVIADSGVRRSLAEGEYAKRRAACERAAAAMGVRALRDADVSMLAHASARMDEDARRCARHVVSENARVREYVAACERGDAAGCGRLMCASHASLRDDCRVSCAELDSMVDAAMRIEGVFGTRMTGAGFGGCTVTMCRAEAVGEVVRVVGGMTRERGGLEPFVARAVGGARAWRV